MISRFVIPTRLVWIFVIPMAILACSKSDPSQPPTNNLIALPENVTAPPAFILAWGDGSFSPSAMDIDSEGRVYVAHYGARTVHVFDSEGNFITKWDGDFKPLGLSVDEDDNVFVTDDENDRVLKFDREGTLLAQWGTAGSGDGEFNIPHGVVASDGIVYVTDEALNRVQKFTPDGTFVAQWGSGGAGDGELAFPAGIDTDTEGNVYVADSFNGRVQKFSSDGVFLGVMTDLVVTPLDVDVDALGNVYVTSFADRVIKVDGNGEFLTSWNGLDVGGEVLRTPFAVVSDANGFVFVGTPWRVDKFGPGGDPGNNDGGGGETPEIPPLPDVDPVAGAIGLYADAQGSTCNIPLTDEPIQTAYVVHTGSGCKIGSSFSAPLPPCMGDAFFVADVVPQGMLAIGSSQTGISIGYGRLIEGPVHILTIYTINGGHTAACCPWQVVDEPRLGLKYVTCDVVAAEEPLPGLHAVVNPDETCPCESPTAAKSRWETIRELPSHPKASGL